MRVTSSNICCFSWFSHLSHLSSPDYTDWYLKRGTDTNAAWAKSATNGHRMAKTKYDWSGQTDPSLKTTAAAKKTFGKKK